MRDYFDGKCACYEGFFCPSTCTCTSCDPHIRVDGGTVRIPQESGKNV